MTFFLFFQIDYEGRRKVSDVAEIEDTIIDVKKSLPVAKEETSLRISSLIANSVYNFNLSARFIDGLWGPPFRLRLETSVQGAFSYQHTCVLIIICVLQALKFFCLNF